jgi:hypothetical protein
MPKEDGRLMEVQEDKSDRSAAEPATTGCGEGAERASLGAWTKKETAPLLSQQEGTAKRTKQLYLTLLRRHLFPLFFIHFSTLFYTFLPFRVSNICG